MVLEPLSAFGLACNVIQVVEVGFKVLSTASEYRKATDGVLAEQKELRDIARTISNLGNAGNCFGTWLASLQWTNSELRTTLEDIVHIVQGVAELFFLIDGLDEFEGSDEEQECLVNLFHDLTLYENVKVCVSSRPLNAFKDHLNQCPQLRLEDLTRNDIELVINSSLGANARFCFLGRTSPDETKDLVASIIRNGSGVFLWVRLVVSDLLKGLRHGDSLKQLQQKLDHVSADLDKYCLDMVESIDPEHRLEASMMPQLALHYETDFTSTRPLCLADIACVEGQQEDFAIVLGYDPRLLSHKDEQEPRFYIKSGP